MTEEEYDEIKSICKQLLLWKHQYYIENFATVSDAIYDAWEEKLKKLDPDNRILAMVGAAESKNDFNKSKHEISMLSLNKDYTVEGIQKFCNAGDTEASFKIDGLSCKLEYRFGFLIGAKTRGDGTVGVEVLENAKMIGSIPIKLPDSFSGFVTGEIYMKKSVFAKHVKRIQILVDNGLEKEENIPSNPRNYASGSFKQEDAIVTFDRELDFIAYDIFERNNDYKYKSEIFTILSEFGFEIPRRGNTSGGNGTIQDLIDAFESARKDVEYEIDGIVFEYNNIGKQKELGFTSHHPKGKIAYKWKAETSHANLIDIEPNVGRTGKLTFVGIYEPTEMSGAICTRCSLHNYEMIEKHNIKIGDTLELMRSGEVIPTFISVANSKSGNTYTISSCPSCGDDIRREGVDLICDNINCPSQVLRKIHRFVEMAEIEDCGKSTLLKLLDANLIQSSYDLYLLTKNKIMSLEGFQEKSAQKLFDNINKRKNIRLDKFLTGLGIKGLGRSAGEMLARKFKNLDSIISLNVEDIIKIRDYESITANQIVSGLKAEADTISRLIQDVTIYEIEEQSNKLQGKSFCLTGSLNVNGLASRKLISELIKQKGGIIKSSVSKDLDYLVADSIDSSTKFKKALELKIEMLSSNYLENLLK